MKSTRNVEIVFEGKGGNPIGDGMVYPIGFVLQGKFGERG
jgi:hypothetical protein